jgi:hypothetical protein
LFKKTQFLAQTAENKAKLNAEFKEKFANMRANCFPRASSGCRCTEKDENGNEITKNYDSPSECTEQHDTTAIEAKKQVNEQLKVSIKYTPLLTRSNLGEIRWSQRKLLSSSRYWLSMC